MNGSRRHDHGHGDRRIRRRYHQQGLTLLEVLAAFLIFSLVFTVLVGSSQTGVHSQGLSSRRLAANEIAESLLADLEIPMARHELPVIDATEYQQDDFTIRVGEAALSANSAAPGAAPVATELDPLAGTDLIGLLDTQLPDVAKYVKRYEIEVEWLEANELQKVTRTTFAFDWPSAQADPTGVFGAAAAGAAGLDGGEAGSDEEDSDSDAEARDGGSQAPGSRGRNKAPDESELERMKRLIREKEAELGLDRQ
jgi:hypothetical protein